MAKRSVCRNAFRRPFALYAMKAHHDHNQHGQDELLKLFGSSKDISDSLLDQWSVQADVLGTKAIGAVLSPRTRETADGCATYRKGGRGSGAGGRIECGC